MKHFPSLFLCLLLASVLPAQVEENPELFQTLWARDSLLFDIGFNTCDISQFEGLVSEDMEFYHDQSGITGSKADFIASIENGLCKLDYKARRKLVEGSLKVFPMKNNGELYGAIQTGEHRFYAKYPDKEEVLTSTAKFTHLWFLEDGEWRLARVLSYDHKPAGKERGTSAELAQIAILGTFHFAGTTDYSSVAFEPLTSEKRQQEILQLVEKLKNYRPTKILVEYPFEKAQRLDSLYQAYLNDEYQLTINEIDQLGFRLARQLGHPAIYAVDYEQSLPFGPFMEFAEKHDKEGLDTFLKSIEEHDEKESRFLEENTILDYFIFRNSDEEDLRNKNLYIDKTAKFINDTTYIGIDFTAKWWERNFYIMGNIDRATEAGDRLLLIIGAGHRAVLRDFFEDRQDMLYVEIQDYLK